MLIILNKLDSETKERDGKVCINTDAIETVSDEEWCTRIDHADGFFYMVDIKFFDLLAFLIRNDYATDLTMYGSAS